MPLLIDHLHFFRSWLDSPREIGAVAPSSRPLARLITQEIDPAGGLVVELGPGTGVFTYQLVENGLSPEKLLLIEKNPGFAESLRRRFPTAALHELDVAHMRRCREQWRALQAQAIVSGLPLLAMGTKAQIAVLRTCFDMLRPGGHLYQFTYHWRCPVPDSILKRLRLKAFPVGNVWWNLPPASVYRISEFREPANAAA